MNLNHAINCDFCKRQTLDAQILETLMSCEKDLVEVARGIVKGASDPFSGVIKFLQDRPDGASLHGYLVHRVLMETFGSVDEIPGLIRAIASHVREVIRQSNVISIVNEHPTTERWGSYIIKQKERMRFEVGMEKDSLVLKNIVGLVGMEHGVEAPLEKITVKPPKLIVTLNMGILHPQKVLDLK
ncbi:MAG TPA: hypothetical protein PLI59_19350 [Candidatus Obscuribacter sp.]|nr:hypothetical protein [Candidatus Obscuribacter sp.]HMY03676.1 hypothetical protein [Candidatus Obscuribacter sp.]HMY55071.1 hypothetical protein [Candidatus Obscuribacter sp.]HND06855.1 hypothetical protein [Candidatus Obscuribacter sp.]HNG21353.1 hypothetical protein [Candidatus Obscuribacter sp.]